MRAAAGAPAPFATSAAYTATGALDATALGSVASDAFTLHLSLVLAAAGLIGGLRSLTSRIQPHRKPLGRPSSPGDSDPDTALSELPAASAAEPQPGADLDVPPTRR